MRIIGGKHRGRVLKEFAGHDIRPTSDRSREALFNIFSSQILGCKFLDLFAGTGAVGLEALSRGAEKVVFTDTSFKAVDLIKQNLQMFKENGQVVLVDGISYLNKTLSAFDFIFIDPPYKTDLGERALQIIDQNGVLLGGGYAVFESDSERKFEFKTLNYISTRKYGKNCFNIYKKVE